MGAGRRRARESLPDFRADLTLTGCQHFSSLCRCTGGKSVDAQLVSNLLECLVDARGASPGPLDIFTLRGEKKFRGAEALGDSLTSGRAPTAAQGPPASRDCSSVGGGGKSVDAQLVSNLFESLVDFRGAFPGPLDIFIFRGENKFRGAEAFGDSLTSGRAPNRCPGSASIP